jgi:hypothetical protein
MSQQEINVGTTANDRKGDSLRIAFQKVNANFTELYTALGLGDDSLNIGAFEFSGSTLTTTDSSDIIIDQNLRLTGELLVDGGISGYLSISQLKSLVAASTDFADFQARIAAL